MSNLEKMMRSLSALQLELHPSIAADVREKVLAVYIEQDSEITKLREAIAKFEGYAHDDECNFFDYRKCNCQADRQNAALSNARKIAGLES